MRHPLGRTWIFVGRAGNSLRVERGKSSGNRANVKTRFLKVSFVTGYAEPAPRPRNESNCKAVRDDRFCQQGASND
jgi:hypothetical protein